MTKQGREGTQTLTEWCDTARNILEDVVPKTDKPEDAWRSALMAESARLEVEIPALVERKRKIDELLGDAGNRARVTAKIKSPAVRPRATRKPQKQTVDNGQFAGMSLQEATRKYLADTNKPLSGREIWPALKEAGFKTASSRPEGAIHWALRKRQHKQKDVMLVEGGKWALTAWYTPEQRAEINRALNGMAGRDRENHSAKTKRGMKLAEKRGVPIGAPKKVTKEIIERLQKHMASGDSIIAACQKEKISVGSFYVLRKDGVPGLERLKGEARRSAVQKAKTKEQQQAPDLLTPTEGSVH